MNSRIHAAINRPEHLAQELSVIPSVEVIGFVLGEPYQPIESRYRITRRLLQVVAEQHKPVIIITKSPSVCEDIPILKEIHQQTFAMVAITIVTLDGHLSRHVEAQAPPPVERLEAVAAFRQAGIPCGIALIPIFPYVTDDEESLTQMFQRFQAVKPDFVVWDSLWIHEGKHNSHIRNILSLLDISLIDRYAELYKDAKQPSALYRRQLDERLLAFCAHYGLAPRIPEHLYEQTLPMEIVTELRQRNRRFINQDHL